MKDETVLLLAGAGALGLYMFNKDVSKVTGGLGDVAGGLGNAMGGVGGAVSDVAGDVADVTGGISGVVVSLTDALTNLIAKAGENVGEYGIHPPGISAIENLWEMWNKLFNNGPSVIDVKKPDTQGATPQQVKNTIDLFNAGSVVNAIENLPQKTTSLTQPKATSSGATTLSVYNEGGNTIAKATGGDLGVSKYTGNPIVEVIKVTTPASSKSSSSKSSSSSVAYKGKTYSIKSSSSGPAIGSSASLQKTKDNIAKSKALTKAKYG